MKAYGIPRFPELEYPPDLADIYRFGLKSSLSRVKGKGGDIKNSFRNIENKANQRRFWKKKARRDAKQDIINELNTYK